MDCPVVLVDKKRDKINRRQEKLVNKKQERERILLHKKMVEEERLNSRCEKIAPKNAFISLKNINKIYPNHWQAVYDFNIDIQEEEFIVLVGPSGCGKSTLLRMIAGLETITAGDLFIDKMYANAIPAKERNIAMVFQNYALYPHLTVYENMEFSLKVQKVNKDLIEKRIRNAAEILDICDYLNRKPYSLSGGQNQRVALGRAIVRDSKIFLMDEPLSNLDAKLRVSMRSEIIKLHDRLKTTTIYVTHDQTEAMTMADRIVVMNNGYVQQIGTPQEIYNRPANIFVASFIGSPAMNLLDTTFTNNSLTFAQDSKIKLDSSTVKKLVAFYKEGLKAAEEELELLEKNNEEKNKLLALLKELEANTPKLKESKRQHEIKNTLLKIEINDKANTRRTTLINTIATYKRYVANKKADVIFGIRPNDILEKSEINEKIKPSGDFNLKVSMLELLGSEYYVHTTFDGKEIIFTTPADSVLKVGDNAEVVINMKKMHIFDSVTEKLIV